MNRSLASLMLSGALLLGASTAHAELPDEATLYKNPQCGCCDEYGRHLEEMGVDVTYVDDVEMGQVKQEAGIPYGLGSCHTIHIGDYVVEGHVPMAALEQLFEQKPNVDGIGLAGMPIGTPGMPGPKTQPYNVYQFRAGGEPSLFMSL